jgi:hypothetical protein
MGGIGGIRGYIFVAGSGNVTLCVSLCDDSFNAKDENIPPYTPYTPWPVILGSWPSPCRHCRQIPNPHRPDAGE